MVEKLRMFGKLQDIITKFNEPSRAFWAQCCGNSQGRFLMIAQYRERGRKEVVMVPKGSGNGARRCEWRGMGIGFAYTSSSYRFICYRR